MSVGEFLSEDILDENFVKCFEPIHITQIILGSIRVDIRDYFVTPTTGFQRLYTCVWIVFATFSLYNFERFYFEQYYEKNFILYFTWSFGIFLQYLAYLINLIQIKFFYGEQNVKMYLMLTKIDRCLKLKDFKSMNRTQYFYNLFVLFFVSSMFGSGYLVHVFCCIDNPALTLFLGMGFLAIQLELLLTGALIYYVAVRLKFLNQLIKYNIIMKKENNIPGVDHNWTLAEEYRIVISGTGLRGLSLNKFVYCLKSILKAYKMISDLYRFQVFTIATAVFFWTFLTIEALAVGVESELIPQLLVVTLSLWVVFYFVQLVALVLTCDWFLKQVANTKAICVYALSVYHDGPFYTAAKGMIRLLDYDKPEFSVYGIFVLDRSLPLKMIGLITGNIIVLLQFTL